MKKIPGIFFFLLLQQAAVAQQTAQARNVQLVVQPNTQIVLKGGISFTGTTTLLHKGKMVLNAAPAAGTADWLDSTSGVLSTASTGHVLFSNTVNLQQVYGPTRFDSISVQGKGINLRQSNEVRQALILNNGLLYFSNQQDSIYISNAATDAVVYNTDSLTTTSWVHGKLSRNMNNSSAAYFFPIGKLLAGDSLYAPVRLNKQNTASAIFSAQYFPAQPFDRNNKNPVIDHISSVEYWEITSHNYVASVDDDAVLSLSWRDYSLVNPLAIIRDSLLVAHYYFDGVSFQWQPEFNAALPNIVNGTVNFGYVKTNKVIGNFDLPARRFTIGTRSPQNLLPLELLEWNVIKQDQQAFCSWLVTDDRDVDYYFIERSTDGIHFVQAGMVVSRKQNGNTSYSFTDHAPSRGRNYYRLKATGNGLSNYSVIRSVYFGEQQSWQLYPNPAHDIINVRYQSGLTATVQLRITDATGKMVLQRNENSSLIQLDIRSLPGSLYYLEIIQSGSREVKSFIKN